MKIRIFTTTIGEEYVNHPTLTASLSKAEEVRLQAAEDMIKGLYDDTEELPAAGIERADAIWKAADLNRGKEGIDQSCEITQHTIDIPLLPAIWWAVKRWLKKLAARVQRRINPSPAHQIGSLDEANDAFFALSSGRSVLQVIDAMRGLPSTRATQLSNTLAFTKWALVHQDEVLATGSTANTRRPAQWTKQMN